MNKILTVLTNWRRKEYLKDISLQIQNQTVKSDIILVDNAFNDINHKFDVQTNISTLNKQNENKCWERWNVILNNLNNYDYVTILDDDLKPIDDQIYEKCVNFLEHNKNIDAVGREGVIYKKEKGYVGSHHLFPDLNKNISVDIIKGRFMFIRSESLKDKEYKPDPTCDDIVVSSHLTNKTIPNFLSKSFEDLVEGNESLSRKSFQTPRREIVSKIYFG
jgi:hypothetical protein